MSLGGEFVYSRTKAEDLRMRLMDLLNFASASREKIAELAACYASSMPDEAIRVSNMGEKFDTFCGWLGNYIYSVEFAMDEYRRAEQAVKNFIDDDLRFFWESYTGLINGNFGYDALDNERWSGSGLSYVKVRDPETGELIDVDDYGGEDSVTNVLPPYSGGSFAAPYGGADYVFAPGVPVRGGFGTEAGELSVASVDGGAALTAGLGDGVGLVLTVAEADLRAGAEVIGGALGRKPEIVGGDFNGQSSFVMVKLGEKTEKINVGTLGLGAIGGITVPRLSANQTEEFRKWFGILRGGDFELVPQDDWSERAHDRFVPDKFYENLPTGGEEAKRAASALSGGVSFDGAAQFTFGLGALLSYSGVIAGMMNGGGGGSQAISVSAVADSALGKPIADADRFVFDSVCEAVIAEAIGFGIGVDGKVAGVSDMTINAITWNVFANAMASGTCAELGRVLMTIAQESLGLGTDLIITMPAATVIRYIVEEAFGRGTDTVLQGVGGNEVLLDRPDPYGRDPKSGLANGSMSINAVDYPLGADAKVSASVPIDLAVVSAAILGRGGDPVVSFVENGIEISITRDPLGKYTDVVIAERDVGEERQITSLSSKPEDWSSRGILLRTLQAVDFGIFGRDKEIKINASIAEMFISGGFAYSGGNDAVVGNADSVTEFFIFKTDYRESTDTIVIQNGLISEISINADGLPRDFCDKLAELAGVELRRVEGEPYFVMNPYDLAFELYGAIEEMKLDPNVYAESVDAVLAAAVVNFFMAIAKLADGNGVDVAVGGGEDTDTKDVSYPPSGFLDGYSGDLEDVYTGQENDIKKDAYYGVDLVIHKTVSFNELDPLKPYKVVEYRLPEMVTNPDGEGPDTIHTRLDGERTIGVALDTQTTPTDMPECIFRPGVIIYVVDKDELPIFTPAFKGKDDEDGRKTPETNIGSVDDELDDKRRDVVKHAANLDGGSPDEMADRFADIMSGIMNAVKQALFGANGGGDSAGGGEEGEIEEGVGGYEQEN